MRWTIPPAPARTLTFALVTLLPLAGRPAEGQWMEAECVDLLEEIGPQSDALFGFLVEDMGDVNDDGVHDFAAASPFHDSGLSSLGRVSVHSGVDGSLIWFRLGIRQSEIHGFSLNVIDDLTGDGVREVIGSGGWNTGTPGGRVLIYDGTDGSTVNSWSGPLQFDNYGHSAATGGDFDGDGVLDIAFSAPGVDTYGTNGGEVHVYSTDDFSLVCIVEPVNTLNESRFGNGLEFIGDVNGDGRDDLAVGTHTGPNWDPPGSIHVVGWDGKECQSIYSINNVNHGGGFDGDLIESGYDYDDDGINDILFGQWSLSEAVLYSGVDGSVIHTFNGDGTEQAFGTGKMIPDIDGDTQPDLIISGWTNDLGANNAGRVYLYSGDDFSLLRTMTPTISGYKLGTGISCFGDHNGDGALDYLIGAPGTSFETSPLGRVFIIAGIPAPPIGDLDGNEIVNLADLLQLLATWGPCDDCPEDLNGDGLVGFADLLLLLANWG